MSWNYVKDSYPKEGQWVVWMNTLTGQSSYEQFYACKQMHFTHWLPLDPPRQMIKAVYEWS